MLIFTGKFGEFLNNFYNELYHYTIDSYKIVVDSFKDQNSDFYSKQFHHYEIASIIIINKAFYQNLFGFYKLLNDRLPFAAFNSLRASLETMRLFRAFFINKDFRESYIANNNLDFRSGSDYEFMQKNVNKVLKQVDLSVKHNNIDNKGVIGNSAISELHNELSRWSHCLNNNMLFFTEINDNRIYLEIEDEYGEIMQTFLRKYLEGSLFILVEHLTTYGPEITAKNKVFLDNTDKVFSSYSEFIKKFY